MATKTMGTNATTSLTALQFTPGLGSGMAAADIASIEQLITPDNRNLGALAAMGGRFDSSGILYLPGERGMIQMKPGDWIAVDNRGWPLVIRGDSATNGAWTHT